MQRRTFSLNDGLDMFLLDCEARRLTPQTLTFYKQKLSVFVHWCEEQQLQGLDDLTARELRQFLVSIQRRGLSSQYQHNLARAIRAFLNFCVRDELIDESPFDRVQMPRVEKKILQAFTAEQIQTVLHHCQTERDRVICLFLLDSGVRASELIAITVGDVNLNRGEVLVRAGKGQKQRTTYIGAITRKQLRRYLSGRDMYSQSPLFASENTGKPLTLSGVVQLMKRLSRRSGVDICTAHTFRRTFAINCLRNGMNIYALARLMGHSDITVLPQYLALVDQDLQQAHQEFGAVDRMFG